MRWMLLSMFLLPAVAVAAAEWEPVSTGSSESQFIALALDPATPTHIIAASPRAVYASSHDGAWQARFQVPAQAAIANLAYAPGTPSTILAATDQGLYGSFDGGERWSRVFKGPGRGQERCTHVAFHPSRPGTALLTTGGGTLLSTDGGHTWKALPVPPEAREAVHAAFDPSQPERLYLLTAHAVFAGTLTEGRWEKRWSIIGAADERPEDAEAPAAEDADEAAPMSLRTIAVHPKDPSTLYVGTSHGIRISRNAGATWESLPDAGLLSTDVSRVLLQAHSPVALYAATARGVARYDERRQRWQMLGSTAMAAVNDLRGSAHHLWAATDRGLLRYEAVPDPFGAPEPLDAKALLGNFVHEPSIGRVREAAIRYAEVHPDKIRLWRRQAALKALLPNVNLGFDRDTSNNIHVDEGTFPNFQVLETRDHDASLDFSITWDLGDLIWNDDQTSIDTRSKLMVQLRDDLVNEVTRTYFERRRLQVALLTSPPKDDPALLEKELRIQELTALIDGLTGGYFSSHLEGPSSIR